MNRSILLFVVAVLASVVLLTGMPAAPVSAFDPPWPAGLPWPTTVPWPTANPLTLGVPWSPSIQTSPVYPAAPMPPGAPVSNAPAPLPPIAPVSSAPAPLPPIAPVSGAPAPLPPIAPVSNALAPLPPVTPVSNVSAPLPPVVVPSNPPAPVSVANPVTSPGGGSSRSDAFLPGDTWRTLGAGGSVWFKIGTGGEHMDVWLDAVPQSGVRMAIYAPESSDQPVGVGTPDKADPTRLLWSGGHWSGEGAWYALITNDNTAAVQYRVISNQQDIGKKTCWSYWEYIGENPVYWTKCQ